MTSLRAVLKWAAEKKNKGTDTHITLGSGSLSADCDYSPGLSIQNSVDNSLGVGWGGVEDSLYLKLSTGK